MSTKVGKIDTCVRDRTLVLMMGLPYAGKSTHARRLSSTMSWPIVSPDAFRVAMHGQRFVQEAEGLLWSLVRISVRALFYAGARSVIVDATHTTLVRRDEWRELGEWSVLVAPVRTPADVCIERARAAEDEAMVDVIEAMDAKIQWPTDREPVLPYSFTR